ncbi:hypothetical protein JYP52_21510 [Nitratireductor aquibiodomus]|uniref:hypothetical protein n=1 Tax=Nitratireductor TaxID=245876 RepID=UPI000DDCE73B|nr:MULTISPECIES: hypothetical protein [Nitratireductor]MBN7763720.1 hypothetical protein [Nitratireductor aquibiodomus]
MSGISTVMKNASKVQEMDSAQVFANVLNTDLHAMKSYSGTVNYQPADAIRLSRILSEYEQMNVASLRSDQPKLQGKEPLRDPKHVFGAS